MINNILKYIKDDEYEIIIKSNKVHIINYIKVLDISYYNIIILVKDNKLIIKGNNLKIEKLIYDELLISGIIKGLELNNER